MRNKQIMVLQSVVFEIDTCDSKALLYRPQGEVNVMNDRVIIHPDAVLQTNTYINSFDSSTWFQLSGYFPWKLHIRISGKSIIELVSEKDTYTMMLDTDSHRIEDVYLCPIKEKASALWSFNVRAIRETELFSARYEIDEQWIKRKVSFALCICTYHRAEFIKKNIKKLIDSRFFSEDDPLCGRMKICVVDNGSELEPLKTDNICILHHKNTGGSGGFGFGLQFFRQNQSVWQLTHVIFMDDDVEFIAESFYRLHALLSICNDNNSQRPVAGRMFRLDTRWVQYTAAEIWNAGYLEHVGFQCDMTDTEMLPSMNECINADYGGWWFCTYPMSYAIKNDPLPFFLHCDDVEYGLRFNQTPIILNGIQVWHETYEYRVKPIIQYYDTRNTLIVNAIYGLSNKKEQVYQNWFASITKLHLKKDFETEYMIIRGMLDFLRPRFFFGTDTEKLHQSLMRKQKFEYRNKLLWRITAFIYHHRYEKAVKYYQKHNNLTH